MGSMLIELGYNVVQLLKRMRYEKLTAHVKQLHLPILLSMDLAFGEANYGHVIGVCPHLSSEK